MFFGGLDQEFSEANYRAAIVSLLELIESQLRDVEGVGIDYLFDPVMSATEIEAHPYVKKLAYKHLGKSSGRFYSLQETQTHEY